jgi:hypothetical protein
MLKDKIKIIYIKKKNKLLFQLTMICEVRLVKLPSFF